LSRKWRCLPLLNLLKKLNGNFASPVTLFDGIPRILSAYRQDERRRHHRQKEKNRK
jgi:hypothetical protein